MQQTSSGLDKSILNMTGEEPVENEKSLARIPVSTEIEWGNVSDEMLDEATAVLNKLREAIKAEQIRRLEMEFGDARNKLLALKNNIPDFETEEFFEEYGFWEGYEEITVPYSIRTKVINDWSIEMRELRKECAPLLKLRPVAAISVIENIRCEAVAYDKDEEDDEDEYIFEEDRCQGQMVETNYERSTQEMPGAPVYPAYHTYACITCGQRRRQRGEYICGVDLAGQPLYAGMTTRQVAEICVCNDPEYGPENCRNPECLHLFSMSY